jgi:ABC-type oligopeptide transport system substrate-binding subunit/class 3 adenylate cyclase
MQCPQCGTENPEGARFCLSCGARLALACPQCNTGLPSEARFCFACGAEVSAPPVPRPAPPAESAAERLQRLVPREFAERLLATRGQVTPERRMVTILFSDVKGSTAIAEDLDPEDVLEIMDGAFDVLIEPVYRYEGTLARLMGDAVLAFFGAPIAHEDDPERAIRAALEITAEAQRYAEKLERERGITSFNVRVGINTGLVVVGEVGSDLRVEYTAMGDAINLASRMEQNAPPGGILISHDTYRHVRGVFDVLAQEPLVVKGKAGPVQTYLVQRAKPRAFRKPVRGVEGIETRMVGRDAELKHLQEAFYTAMEDGELQVVTISGEAGVGKSRLLYEFDTWSELLPEQFYYFKARAFPEMQNLPYGLIRDLVAFRFQIQDSAPAAGVREKLEDGVGLALGEDENSQAAAHLIGHLLGFEIGESTHLEAVQDDAQRMRDQALAHLVDYFKGMAGQLPVLILLEDLHWADDSSLDTLNHLSQALTGQPLMVVGAARPALFERRPHWGEGQPFHIRLELQSLSKWDSRRLVAEILQRVPEVPQVLRDLIVAGAEGNPFFIEELIKMLVEDGVIVKGEEEWRVAPDRLAGLRVPPTLTGVLQARVDRLPLEERAILQQASVVGRLFWDRAVARINESAEEGIDETEVVDSLSALRSREMVFQRENSAFADAQEYIFKHALLREVTYESVLKRVRRVYHGLVADWLLEQSGERVEEYTGLIADHLALAGRTAEAVEYLLQAGDRARGLYAHQEAIGAYERALTVLKAQDDDGKAARTLMKLGLTHHNAFQYQRSRQAYEEGFALWQRVSQARPAVPPPPAPHALRLHWGRVATLDAVRTAVATSTRVIDQLFCGLVELNPQMDVVPGIAQSWEVLDGGRRYVFHLRDDVVWSDGVPVTAGDFAYAWQLVLDPSTGSPNASLLYDVKGAQAFHEGQGSVHEVGVRAVDEGTLVVRLERPAGYFLQLLKHSATFPVPRHVVEAHGEAWTETDKVVTNGPFRLASWQPDESLTLIRNPTYHGQFTGNLERVELTLLSGERTPVPLEMYEAGSLDVVGLGSIPVPDLDRARQAHAGELVSAPELETDWVSLFPTGPPLDDVRVRRALVLATDRESLADVVWGGTDFPAAGGLVPPGMPGHSPGIGLPYDPELARQLLAEAGYPGGRSFPPVDAFIWYPSQRQVSEYLQTQWLENLGIEIAWEMVDLSTRDSEWQTDQLEQAHLFLSGWVADYPDPDNFLRLGALTAMPQHWSSPAYRGLITRTSTPTNQAERLELYRQADRMAIEEAVVMPLTYGRVYLLVKPWVSRYPVSPMGSWFWKDVVIEPH